MASAPPLKKQKTCRTTIASVFDCFPSNKHRPLPLEIASLQSLSSNALFDLDVSLKGLCKMRLLPQDLAEEGIHTDHWCTDPGAWFRSDFYECACEMPSENKIALWRTSIVYRKGLHVDQSAVLKRTLCWIDSDAPWKFPCVQSHGLFDPTHDLIKRRSV